MKSHTSIFDIINLLQFFDSKDLKKINDSISDEAIQRAWERKDDWLKDIFSTTTKKKEKKPQKKSNIYLIKNNRNDLIKIGRSDNPLKRERTLQSEEPELELILTISSVPVSLEFDLHIRFGEKRIRGEWFALNDEDINYVKKLKLELE